MRRVVQAALLIASTSALTAQETARPPSAPDSVLTPGPNDVGFEAWRNAVAARGLTGASFLIQGDRYQVLVLTPMAVDALAPDSLVVKNTRGCQAALQLSDAQVDSSAGLRPWAAFDAATRARPVIAFVVLPAESRLFDCHAGQLARFAAAARGVIYGIQHEHAPSRDAERVEVRREGMLELAELAGRAPVTKIGRGKAAEDGSTQVRIYVRAEMFAPDADNRASPLELHVWSPDDDEREVIPIPEAVTRAVWQQMLPWRATLLGADGGTLGEHPALDLAVPRDSALRVADEHYHAGEFGLAAAGSLNRLMYRPLPPRTETRDAMLRAASVFAAYDENQAAMSLVSDVLDVFPCLTLAPGASELLRSMVERARRPARCTSIALPVIALRSIVPGGGQATGPGRRRLALVSLGATGGSYLVAGILHSYARREYARYLDYRGFTDTPARAIVHKAQTLRDLANGATIAAVGVWSFAAVEAIVAEHQHARRLAEVRNVGGAKRPLRVSPVGSSSGFGLAVSFR